MFSNRFRTARRHRSAFLVAVASLSLSCAGDGETDTSSSTHSAGPDFEICYHLLGEDFGNRRCFKRPIASAWPEIVQSCASRSDCQSSDAFYVYPGGGLTYEGELHGFTGALQEWNRQALEIFDWFVDREATMQRDNMVNEVFRGLRKAQRVMVEEVLDRYRDDAVPRASRAGKNDFFSRVRDQTDPLMAELAADNSSAQALQELIDEYDAELVGANGDMSATVDAFRAFRDSEATLVDALTQIATDAASADDFDSVAALKAQVASLNNDEASAVHAIRETLRLTRERYVEIQRRYGEQVADHLGFLNRADLEFPDRAGEAIAALDEMIGYVQRRETRMNAAIVRTMEGLRARGHALIALRGDDLSREQLEQSAAQRAASSFAERVNERIEEVWASPPRSATLNLTLVSDKLATMRRFLEFGEVCAQSQRPPWMDQGCQFVANQEDRVSRYVSANIPFVIRFQTARLRSLGVDAELLDAIDDALQDGRLADAASQHDTAVAIAEADHEN